MHSVPRRPAASGVNLVIPREQELSAPVESGHHPNPRVTAKPHEILRFQRCERHLHWAIAIPFKVCYATALILVMVYNPNPTRPYREIVTWIHRGSGVALAVLPPLMIFLHWREFRIHLQNIRHAWSWKLDDVKWLFLMGPASLSKKISLPHQGKFNAAEKINFIVVMSTYPLYVITGLTIWFFRPAYLSWLIHFAMATAATPLILGHIFMATVNPDTRVGLRGMFTGFVNREWARHHYRLWYDEHFGHLDRDDDATQPFIPVTPVPCRPVATPVVAAPQPVVGPARPAAAPAAAPAPAGTSWILSPSPIHGGACARARSLQPLRHHVTPDAGLGEADLSLGS